MNFEQMISDRNKALFSLNKKKIQAYANKYNVVLPKGELAFWGGVYKAIYNITETPDELRKRAEKWLIEHGMSPEIK